MISSYNHYYLIYFTDQLKPPVTFWTQLLPMTQTFSLFDAGVVVTTAISTILIGEGMKIIDIIL